MCGAIGGGSFGGAGIGFFGGLSHFGFLPNSVPVDRSRYHQTPVPIDDEALVDPSHPGHREAIQAIAHAPEEKRDKILAWLKEELSKVEPGSDTKK
jgi:hypothetical protein